MTFLVMKGCADRGLHVGGERRMRVEVALYERGLAHALGTEYHQFGVERSGLGGGRVSMGGCIDAGHEDL